MHIMTNVLMYPNTMYIVYYNMLKTKYDAHSFRLEFSQMQKFDELALVGFFNDVITLQNVNVSGTAISRKNSK